MMDHDDMDTFFVDSFLFRFDTSIFIYRKNIRILYSMSIFLYVNEEESMGKVNIDELYEKNKVRNLKQLSIFNKILNRIHNRIKLTGRNKRNDQFIWFNVPEYLFGEPVYDKGECIAYIVNKLQDNGFLVKYVHPNTLFVSWSNWVPLYIRSEFKKKTGKIMNEKGEIIESIKEVENNEDDINQGLFNHSSSQNSASTKKDGKQYTPIDKYKPTGKFVYNPDILEKIEKRVY
jgi:hypothetical protein